MLTDDPPVTEAGAEFRFTERDFQRTRSLIYSAAGIALSEAKRQMVYTRLARRLRALSLKDFRAYLDLVEQDPGEVQSFINALTTNLTSFFREQHHFPMLAEHLAGLSANREIRIWCSASSTGEEPYSIAITAYETLGESALTRVRITASDLDTNVLATARQGVYALNGLEDVPKDVLRRYFLRGTGERSGQVRVKDAIRGMIDFRRINLLDADWPVPSPIDVIFCRNVMIYFDRPTQRRILERFAPLLTPEGLLFSGHSESLSQAGDLFRLLGKTVYRRVSAGASA